MSLRFLTRSSLYRRGGAVAASLGLRSLPLAHHLNHSRTSRRWHGDHHHHHHLREAGKAGERVFRLGFTADISLAVGKALTGYLSSSTAIIADAAHSVSDVVFSGVALWSFKASRGPASKEHPYGANGSSLFVDGNWLQDLVTGKKIGIGFEFNDLCKLLGKEVYSKKSATCKHPLLAYNFLVEFSGTKDPSLLTGRGKFESLGALGISCMLLVSAGGIAWHAVDILYGLLTSSSHVFGHPLIHERDNSQIHGGHHHAIDLDHPLLALSMMVASISVKEWLYQITKRAGDKDGSGLMKANAWHHRADAVSSLVALIGVGGAIVGVPFLDPLAGLLVSGMILRAGVESGYQSVMELVDAGVPLTLLAPIKRTVLQVEGVKGCHRLRGRKAGSSLYLDIHIEVEPFLSVSAAHDISESIRQQIHKSHGNVAEAYINFDPLVSDTLTSKEKTSGGEQSREIENIYLKKCNIEKVVSDVFSAKFQEMSMEQVTPHLLQGKVLLEIQVSMPPSLVLQDAMRMAKEAEVEILKADPSISQANILLRLGNRIPQIQTVVKEGLQDC